VRHKVFAVRDTCAGTFLVPWFFLNKASAVRALGDAVNRPDKDSNFHQHPEHFQLYELGDYDDEQGLIVPYVAPEFVVDCQSLVR